MLSVCIVTYNQERYIRRCIESVFEQETSFPFVVRVGDDCSTDGTQDILAELERKYTGRLEVLRRSRNMGAALNFEDVVLGSNTKYVAFLEGDNYWTDPAKLQLQVDTLEADPALSFCFHRSEIRSDTQPEAVGVIPNHDVKATLEAEDFIQASCSVQLGSMVMRRPLLQDMRAWTAGLRVGDLPIVLMLAVQGPVRYIDRTMSVQRHHEGGSWTRLSPWARVIHTVHAYEHIKPLMNDAARACCDAVTGRMLRWVAGEMIVGDEAALGEVEQAMAELGQAQMFRALLAKTVQVGRSEAKSARFHQRQLEQRKAKAGRHGTNSAGLARLMKRQAKGSNT